MEPRATCWTLIRDAAGGREPARAEFARRYEPVIREYLAARWRNRGLAAHVEDAVQEVFVDCLREGGVLARADPERAGGFRGFLYGVARRAAQRVEAEVARARRGRDPGSFRPEEVERDETTLSKAFDRAWAGALLREAGDRFFERARELDEASAKRAELLRLRFEDELPIREIARRWEVDPARLHHDYARARREFRAVLIESLGFHQAAPPERLGAECDRLAGAPAVTPGETTGGRDELLLDAGLRAYFAGRSERSELDTVLAQIRARVEPQAPDATATDRNERYRFEGEIAQGGIGVVYRGRDVDLGRDVALKVLHDRYVDEPAFVRRFVEEARIGGRLQHPAIVPGHELGLADGRPYFAMKLIEGETLAELFAHRRSPADERRRFLGVFEQVCHAVAYAHAHGVIHRDLKPANVMVGSFGEVQVVDWGLAKDLGSASAESTGAPAPRSRTDSMAGSVMGTPAYMSPEQARGAVDELDARTDVFALGAIACEILTGTPPYDGEPRTALESAREHAVGDALRRLEGCDADPELVELVRECLAATPARRPPDAGHLARRVAAHLAAVEERSQRAELRAAEERVKAAHARRAQRLTAGLAAAVVVACVAIGAYTWNEWRTSVENREAVLALRGALGEADRLRAAAEAGGDERVPWIEAVAAAERAKAMLGSLKLDDALRARADTTERAARAGLEQAEAAVATRARDDAMRARLEQIPLLALAPAFRTSTADPRSARVDAYAREYRAYGVDVATLPDEEVVRRVTESALRTELAYALYSWAIDAHALDPDAGEHARLRGLARAAAPDDWIDGVVGTLFETGAKRAVGELVDAADAAHLPADTCALVASALEAAGDEGETRAFYDAAWLAHPGAYGLATQAGTFFRTRRDAENVRALRCFRAALAVRPDDPEALLGVGLALSDLGEPEAALDVLRRAVDRGADHRARIGIAHALFRTGDVPAARNAFEEVLEERPDDRNAAMAFGELLAAEGLHAEACARFEQAIALDAAEDAIGPQSVWPHVYYGLSLHQLHRCGEALSSFRRARDARDDLASVHGNLAVELMDTGGDSTEALAAARRAVELDGGHEGAWYAIARIEQSRGESERSLEAATRAVELGSSRANLYWVLGRARYELNDYEEAIAAFERSIELDPAAGESWISLAHCHAERGRARRARECYRTALPLVADRPDWKGAVEEWLDAIEPLAEGEERLLSVLAGDAPPASPREAIAAAQLGERRERYGRAVELYAGVFGAGTEAARQLHKNHVTDGMCAAALAATAGGAPGEPPTGSERRTWRRHALAWGREFVAFGEDVLADGPEPFAPLVAGVLEQWLARWELAGVRDEEALRELLDEEREEWQAFWDDVERLREALAAR